MDTPLIISQYTPDSIHGQYSGLGSHDFMTNAINNQMSDYSDSDNDGHSHYDLYDAAHYNK